MEQFTDISATLSQFIAEQKLFFVGTATADSRVNISPKGMDSLRVLGPNRVLWLNASGSGNETAAHILHNPRMTLMWCSFEGDPLILRLYGSARAVHLTDPDWESLSAAFDPIPGARQIFDMHVDFVQTSCGWAVPIMAYMDERTILTDWARRKERPEEWTEYWAWRNQKSIDGIETHILVKNALPASTTTA